MLKSSLLEIIRTFTKQELIKFEDFVRSPYFNKKENVINLFLEIKKYSPDYENENLKKEKIWKTLFPDKKYNYGIFKNLIFDINKLLERFIVVLKAEEDEFKKPQYILFYLDERNLAKIFYKKYDSIERNFTRDDFKRSDFGINEYYGFWHDLLIIKHRVSIYTKRDNSLLDSFALNSMLNFLINSFKLFQMLVVSSNSTNMKIEDNPIAYFIGQISLKSFERILENIKKISETDHLFLKIYYFMYLMFIEKTDERYLNFKKILFDNLKIFSRNDLKDLHYCLLAGNDSIIESHTNFTLEKLVVFDSMIRQNIITEPNGVMAEHVFISYVTLAFYESDIRRVNKFSEIFIDKLKEDLRSNTSKYVKALNLIIEGRYKESLNIISQLETNYFNMKLHIRYLKARCLYKTEDYELFLNDYDSIKHFIKNNDKLNNLHRIHLEKYYYFLNLLFKLRAGFNEYDLLRLKKEVSDFYTKEQKTFRNERKLFITEINELEKNFIK